MTTHTPAPWRLKESPHKKEFSYWIDAGPEVGSYFIAAVNNGTGPDEENARLIAAAPELLAALEAITVVPSRYDLMPSAAMEMYNIARAAIAVATGQQ